MSDYNLKSPKSILETEKTLKTLSSGQIYLKNQKKQKNKIPKKKNPKKPQKNKKKQKNQKKTKKQKTKKTLGWFFFKPGFFPTLPAGGGRGGGRG